MGVCCVTLSISSTLPEMPLGKPAGIKCIHLSDDYRCYIYFSTDKPKVCTNFNPEPEFCGTGKDEALKIFYSLSKLGNEL